MNSNPYLVGFGTVWSRISYESGHDGFKRNLYRFMVDPTDAVRSGLEARQYIRANKDYVKPGSEIVITPIG